MEEARRLTNVGMGGVCGDVGKGWGGEGKQSISDGQERVQKVYREEPWTGNQIG